ncbi:competence protein CoiA family protein [Psychrobacter sp. NPDC078409]|uniref:competence protein CoiA family protein n=1 Tax=Psychrobacter sp. NPDC078409 TaxID=3390660 RepID=UPI003D064594
MTMSIAVNEQKQIVNVKQVERGLACMCFCFECGEPVVARKGEKNEHHFAHLNNKESCTIHPESILHKFAKQVIMQERYLTLPSLPDDENSEDKTWQFDHLIEEQSIGCIRPDIVATVDDEMMFIEVAVTSFIDTDKADFIKQLGIKTVEIDLRDIMTQGIEVPSEEAKDYILDCVSNKQWIFPAPKSLTIPVAPTLLVESTYNCQTVTENNINESFDKSYDTYRFTINHAWVDVRVFKSGMVSVKCVNFNHDVIEILKQWRNEGGGQYNQKYKSWNYFKPFSDIVFQRLQEMDMTPTA